MDFKWKNIDVIVIGDDGLRGFMDDKRKMAAELCLKSYPTLLGLISRGDAGEMSADLDLASIHRAQDFTIWDMPLNPQKGQALFYLGGAKDAGAALEVSMLAIESARKLGYGVAGIAADGSYAAIEVGGPESSRALAARLEHGWRGQASKEVASHMLCPEVAWIDPTPSSELEGLPSKLAARRAEAPQAWQPQPVAPIPKA